jgi:hypothetical protein
MAKFSLVRQDHGMLSQYLFFHYYIALVVQFAFMPESTMRQMVLACGGANGHLLGGGFVVGASFISACLGGFAFWIWHNNSKLVSTLLF